ncbi:distal membrane-arm assembly complex protein 1-like [Gorilla gorilla gorilla]|uniref:distal membrane-arm assembly complex protein 1-like n=1 Tax=Gorilla gorilla gorilla TaxID=9595 RepID=UPI00300A3073
MDPFAGNADPSRTQGTLGPPRHPTLEGQDRRVTGLTQDAEAVPYRRPQGSPPLPTLAPHTQPPGPLRDHSAQARATNQVMTRQRDWPRNHLQLQTWQKAEFQNTESQLSQPFESLKIAAPPDTAAVPAKPAPPATPGAPTSPAEHRLLKTCWSCHVLSGLRLMGAGGYVYWVARKPMKMGYPPGPWTIMKMVMGLSIAAWGIIVMADPKGKAYHIV